MTTWNDVRRNLTDRLNRLDYALMDQVDGGHARRTVSGKDVVESRSPVDGRWEDQPRSTRKLRRLGMVADAQPGEKYSLTPDGEVALKAWRAERETAANPSSGDPT